MTRTLYTSTAALLALAMSASFGAAQEAGQGEAGQGAGAGADAGAGGAEHTTFEDRMDLNKDVETDFGTFSQSFDEWGVYDRWDTDRDENLTRDEFNRGVFGMYDRDQDEVLAEDEIVGMQNERFFGGEGVRTLGEDDDRIE